MRIFTVLFVIVFSFIKTYCANEFHLSGLQVLMQENGLANNTLQEIHQDKVGFLWLGTDVGISRYDGIHFHNYSLKGNEPQAVKRICEAEKDGLLWLKTDNNSAACFDKSTGCFIQLESTDSIFLNERSSSLLISPSGITRSMTSSSNSSEAVNFIISAASDARRESFHKIDANPSGDRIE